MLSEISRLAVYTVAVDWPGGLPPLPKVDDVDFICFVRGKAPDDSNGWQLERLKDFPELDGPRLSRLPKLLPHLFLPSHRLSIFIDTSVKLSEDFLSKIPDNNSDVRLSLIQLRRNLGQEFDAVASRRYDSLYHIAEQQLRYARFNPGFREMPSFWGGLIVRNHFDHDVIDFGYRWALNVLRYSRRDQLSLPIALSDFPREKLGLIDGSDEESPLHFRLPGVSKSPEYVLGDSLLQTEKGLSLRDRESLYVAEIRSLRKLLRSRFLNVSRSFFRLK